MEKTSTIGKNRTGIQTSPKHVQELLAAVDAAPVPSGDEMALAALRQREIREADLIGSVPPPVSAKGALKAGARMMTGARPQTLIDKIAERLAFERTGVRLYEALITKHQAKADELRTIPLESLMQIRKDEAQHFALLIEALQMLGADPTAQTPCADLAGVESMGLVQAISDPRTTFTQSLHAILIAELADNDGWEMLIDLAQLEKQDGLAESFRSALEAEERHLDQVRTWLRELVQGEAHIGARAS